MCIICVTDKLFCKRKSVWPNYYVLENLLWKQKSWKLHATIKFGAYIFLGWYLKKKKKCKHKYYGIKVKSLKPQSTLGLLLKPGPGPWKTWILKNMDLEKHWINMGLKNKSAFREFNKGNVWCDLKFCVLTFLFILFIYWIFIQAVYTIYPLNVNSPINKYIHIHTSVKSTAINVFRVK